jgi:hypothetical protein
MIERNQLGMNIRIETVFLLTKYNDGSKKKLVHGDERREREQKATPSIAYLFTPTLAPPPTPKSSTSY